MSNRATLLRTLAAMECADLSMDDAQYRRMTQLLGFGILRHSPSDEEAAESIEHSKRQQQPQAPESSEEPPVTTDEELVFEAKTSPSYWYPSHCEPLEDAPKPDERPLQDLPREMVKSLSERREAPHCVPPANGKTSGTDSSSAMVRDAKSISPPAFDNWPNVIPSNPCPCVPSDISMVQ